MEHKLNGKVLLAIQLPDDCDTSYGFAFDSTVEHWLRYYPKNRKNSHDSRIIYLPSGQWQILGIAGQLDESVCRGLVGTIYQYEKKDGEFVPVKFLGFRDYEERFTFPCDTALESWQSFMKSENIPQNYLILVKQ